MPFYLAMYWSASTQVGNINLGIPPHRRATQIMGKWKGMGLSRLYGTAKRNYLPCNNHHANTGYNTKISFGWSKTELTPRTAVLSSFLLQVSYFCRTSANGSKVAFWEFGTVHFITVTWHWQLAQPDWQSHIQNCCQFQSTRKLSLSQLHLKANRSKLFAILAHYLLGCYDKLQK